MKMLADPTSGRGLCALAFAAALGVSIPEVSQACGACVEDKVAATYDHAVVERARARGDTIVFSEITGPLDAPALKAAVRRVRGVKPQSVRVSVQPAALSFALDPRVQSPRTAVAAVQRGVPSDTRLTIVRLMAAGPDRVR